MKILDSVIKFGKAFESLSQVGKFAVVIGLTYLAFNVGTCDGNSKLKEFKVKYEQLQTEAIAAKSFGDTAKKKINQLNEDVKSKDTTIKRLTISIEFRDAQSKKLKNSFGNLERDLIAAKDTAELVQIQEHMIDNLKTQVAEAESTIFDQRKLLELERYKVTKLDTAVALAMQRGDSLQKVVDKLISTPPPPTPRTWPSKKTIGVIGFVGGVLAGDYLARR